MLEAVRMRPQGSGAWREREDRGDMELCFTGRVLSEDRDSVPLGT